MQKSKTDKQRRNWLSADQNFKVRGPGWLCTAPNALSPTRVHPPLSCLGQEQRWAGIRRSEDQTFYIQAVNSSQECHGNFHSEWYFAGHSPVEKKHVWKVLKIYQTPTHPDVLQSFICVFNARIKSGQWEEIHVVWRPLLCSKQTKWFYYVGMAVRCSFHLAAIQIPMALMNLD